MFVNSFNQQSRPFLVGGGGGDRLGSGHGRILYKAPEDYTKPQNIIQRPKIFDETLKNMQNQKILDKNQKY